MVVDTVMRMTDLKAHYTDMGVLPRHVLTDSTSGLFAEYGMSIYLVGGSPFSVAVLMIFQIILALLLIAGFKTKLVTLILWIMVLSLQLRNPMVITGGDSLLSLLLLWSIFLPLGARYSVDKAMNEEGYDIPHRHVNVATAGIVIQILCVYLFNWLNKLDPAWTMDHTALYYALNADLFVTHLGKALGNFFALTQALTMTVHMFQLIGPVLLFLPFWNQTMRFVVISGFVSFHIGIALTLNIGYFPYVSIISWLILVPGVLWDWLDTRRAKQIEPMIMYYDEGCNFCIKTVLLLRTFLMLDFAPLKPVQSDNEINKIFQAENTWVVRRHNKGLLTKWDGVLFAVHQSYYFRWLGYVLSLKALKRWGESLYRHISGNRGNYSRLTVKLKFNRCSVKLGKTLTTLAVCLGILVVFWNVTNIRQLQLNRPSIVSHVGSALGVAQKWSMFAPHPIRADGWLVAPGVLTTGESIDVRTAKRVTWDKPSHVAATYDNNRWRKYLVNLKKEKQLDRRVYYGKYLCREWYDGNRLDNVSLDSFNLFFMLEYTQPHGSQPTTEKQLLWSHSCFPNS